MLDIKWIVAKGLKVLLHPPALRKCVIDKTSKVCSKTEMTECIVGRYSYVGYGCFMVNVEIGSFCSIADRCSIGGAMHPMDYVSTSPVFHEGKNVLKKNFSKHVLSQTPVTRIENDVWIGQGAYIKAGVKIGTGAVIGMGAVVTKDVGEYEVWGGNPARLLKKRFDDDTITNLLNSRWWDMEENDLHRYARFFNDPKQFIGEIK